ncbi:MAG: hypothetical protein IJ048_13695 [Clostridia bacterium]|nr:hypothetical protein [Clostridia bacterium]
MRTITPIAAARFQKPGQPFEVVALPHTWNALDGQDGGNDYFRGECTYEIDLPAAAPGLCRFIEFEAANHIARVFAGETPLFEHRGGFSTFRVDLTGISCETLTVKVDNVAPDVYPQRADFTFFGGLYRPVRLIEVPAAHIDLTRSGSAGVFVTPDASGRTKVEVYVTEPVGCAVCVELIAPDGSVAARGSLPAEEKTVFDGIRVESPVLWNGVKGPNLYTARVTLVKDGEALDEVCVRYGYRGFSVDPEQGFILNGKSCPLHGVCRHQDRENFGWAISDEHHREDMALIQEIGANTIRLAHYQHSQTFYDLCDEAGMVVWAEIPFISVQTLGEAARENTMSQMRELILQNYNHPSICFWGIGNELTMGPVTGALEENLRALDQLARALDPTRLTTIAHLGMVKPGDVYTGITDVQSFNYYFGWYSGDISDNATVLDEMHAAMPGRPIGVSEYGADALITWHSAKPKNHDYTEEYQAKYHAAVQKIFAARPYLWATHAWNMFDFAADARDEGGCQGRNNKGLVTYDRKVKKDAFYLYKAAWRSEPVVHVCGRRFADRAPGERDVIVFSNCPEVTLLVNGQPVATEKGDGYVFTFHDVPLKDGANSVCAVCGEAQDEITLNGVDRSNVAYLMPPESIVAGNWFDEETGEQLSMQYPEGYFSIRDTVEDLSASPEAAAVMAEVLEMIRPPKAPGDTRPDNRPPSMRKAPGFMPLQMMIKRMGMMGKPLSPVQIIRINQRLNKIKKP